MLTGFGAEETLTADLVPVNVDAVVFWMVWDAEKAALEVEKDTRVVLAEIEQDIASMLLDAARIYREDELALKLRQMHLLNESMKESKGSVVVPSAYAEGFTEGALEDMPKRG